MSTFSALKRHESPTNKIYVKSHPVSYSKSSPKLKRYGTPETKTDYIYSDSKMSSKKATTEHKRYESPKTFRKKGGRSKKSKYVNKKIQRKTKRKYN